MLLYLPAETVMEFEAVAAPLPPLSPFDPATMIQSLDEQGWGLRAVFFRPQSAQDRWGHVIATVGPSPGGENVTARLVSHEGAGRDGWPLSPPLQSLAIERRPEGAVALLVGMAGQSHWSASFEALADRRLKIDIACRLGAGAGESRLGSRYAANAAPVAPSPGRVALDLSGKRQLLIAFGPEIEEKVASDSVFLGVRGTTKQPVRWQYELYCG